MSIAGQLNAIPVPISMNQCVFSLHSLFDAVQLVKFSVCSIRVFYNAFGVLNPLYSSALAIKFFHSSIK